MGTPTLFYVKKMTSTFTQDKRKFLHKQLDEVILLWARGTGQGSFTFTVNEGTPELQLGIQLGLEDTPGQHQHPHQHDHQTPRRQRGPARRQRDRERAARHQAAKAAAPAAKPPSFPGVGIPVGSAARPTLPLPLCKGAVFPPFPSTTAPVCPTPTTYTAVSSTLSSVASSMPTISFPNNYMPNLNTKTTASLTQPLTPTLAVPVRDAVVSESDSEDEQYESCGQCLKKFDDGSAYCCCPRCVKYFHIPQCADRHQCIAVS